MQAELIQAASELFPTFEHWRSFLELSNNINGIMEFWFTEATQKIRTHFKESLSPKWGYEPWGVRERDTRWFLRDFGSESLGVAYSWHYRLDLRIHDLGKFNAQSISRLLKEIEYAPIEKAFDRIDFRFVWGSELIEKGNFKFEARHDGNVSEQDLAWHAAHQMDSFVNQAIAKIERFTNNPTVTELLRQLNQIAQDESQAMRG